LSEAAVFSEDRRYRYLLRRFCGFGNNGVCLFIMLNPSTADETRDDPTIRRCIRYANRWEYNQLLVCNLFSFRTVSPQKMKEETSPIGKENDWWIENAAKHSNLIVLAWGNHGNHLQRSTQVVQNLRKIKDTLYCLGQTNSGEPLHPLYLPNDAQLQEYTGISVTTYD